MTCVYFMYRSSEPDRIKIGFSSADSPEGRDKAYATASSSPLVYSVAVGGTYAEEQSLHKCFTRVPDSPGREWFLRSAELTGLIAQVDAGDARAIPRFLGTLRRKAGSIEYTPAKKPITRVSLNGSSTSFCSSCENGFPLQLRQTADGTVRDQPQCGKCRSKKKREAP